jgi:hypothetical protein
MAKAKTGQAGTLRREPKPKRTSIGHGHRKLSSLKKRGKYRGQGHG